MQDPDLGALVAAAADGDNSALDAVANRYAPLLLAVARAYGLSDEDTQDAQQTTWLRLIEHRAHMRDPAALQGWLVTTMRHEALLLRRRAARELPGDVPERPDEPASRPEETALRGDRDAALRIAFSRLAPRCQVILTALFKDPPPSYTETAKQLGITVGSIGPTRSRCIQQLRALLADTHLDVEESLRAMLQSTGRR